MMASVSWPMATVTMSTAPVAASVVVGGVGRNAGFGGASGVGRADGAEGADDAG